MDIRISRLARGSLTQKVSGSVSRNYFSGDPHVYGCLYHDGGSSLWTDENNVFNHMGTSAVFCHGSCPGISISPICK